MKTLLILLSLLCTSVLAESLPVEAFGKLPQVSDFVLSPDGQKAAYAVHSNGDTLVGIRDFVTGDIKYLLKTDNEKFKITWYVWANNELLLVSTDYPVFHNGTAYKESRLLKVKADGSQDDIQTVVSPKLSSTWKKNHDHIAQFQNRIVDILPDEPHHILMAVDFEVQNLPTVYKVDLRKKMARTTIQKRKNNIKQWIVDRQHRVRLAKGRDETRAFYNIKDLKTGEWRTLWDYDVFKSAHIEALGFALDPNILYFRTDNNGYQAVFKLDVSKKGAKKELVYFDENKDVDGDLLYSNISNDVIGISGFVNDDKDINKLKKGLDKAIPNASNKIISLSNNQRQYILYSRSGAEPGAYYYGDRDKGGLGFLADDYPSLYNKGLADKTVNTFKTRDGATLEVNVTPPFGGFSEKNPSPAVVLLHLGLMSQDQDSFDWLTAFLSNRGYAVIQPKYRGAGNDRFRLALKPVSKSGSTMLDDIEDTVSWLSNNYSINQNKISAFGRGQGGYAAMMALAKKQGVFASAVSFSAVSDIKMMMVRAQDFGGYDVIKRRIGNDSKVWKENSPITYAGEINVPILLIHGSKDRVTTVDHSQDMYRKLKHRNKKVEYLELEKGNHFLEIERNRLAMLNALDVFLKKHN